MEKPRPADSLPVSSEHSTDTQKSSCVSSLSKSEQQTVEVIAKTLLTKFSLIIHDRTQSFLDDQERARQEDIKRFFSLARPGGSPVFPSCSDDDESDEQEGK